MNLSHEERLGREIARLRRIADAMDTNVEMARRSGDVPDIISAERLRSEVWGQLSGLHSAARIVGFDAVMAHATTFEIEQRDAALT